MFYELFLFERNHLCRGGKMIFVAVKRAVSSSYKVPTVDVT